MNTRIVKPRSARQRAAAEAMKRRSAKPLPLATGPSSSWWLGLSRQQLQARAHDELRRMAYSRFGRIHSSGQIQE